MTEKLNKIQIKRIVFDVIEKYTTIQDFKLPFHQKNLEILNSINNHTAVTDILLKELYVSKDFNTDIIIVILSDFAELNDVEETLWKFLQDKKIEDNKKEKILSLLRNLGGKIDTAVLYDCLDNFSEVVDKETQDLLETATINMEAQIDFLDFLETLPEEEQIMLLTCLSEDYESDQIVGVFAPTLKYTKNKKIQELIIQILGKSKSYMSIDSLKFISQTSHDEKIKRLCIKALNQLKKDGINIEDEEKIYLREKEICSATKIYKTYITEVDGSGKQGIIFSRISNTEFIEMFNVVISIREGIVDCFGFSTITKKEFLKILNRVKSENVVVQISPGEIKYKLNQAMKINIENDYQIPYEYICWSAYLYDIEEKPIIYQNEWNENDLDFEDKDYKFLYENEIFDIWFFDYGENFLVDKIIEEVITEYKENKNINIEFVENLIKENYENIFDKEKKEEISKMLLEQAFIFEKNNQNKEADLCIKFSKGILNKEERFLKDFLRKSVVQYIANIVYEEDDFIDERFNKTKPTLSKKQAKDLLNKIQKLLKGYDIE